MNKFSKIINLSKNLSKMYITGGRKSWSRCDLLPGYLDTKMAINAITMDDMIQNMDYFSSGKTHDDLIAENPNK